MSSNQKAQWRGCRVRAVLLSVSHQPEYPGSAKEDSSDDDTAATDPRYNIKNTSALSLVYKLGQC